MNPWQIEKQLAYLLAAQVWPDSPGAKILAGGARVSERRARDLVGELTVPFALVRRIDASAVRDVEHPERYIEVAFEVELAVENWTDPYGSSVTGGGSRESVGKSGGRGADELIEELQNQLNAGRFVASTHGFQGLASEVRTERIQGVTYVFATYRVVAYSVPIARRYHEARQVLATGGAGQVALSWALPPDRFDRLRMIVRRSAAGGSAPQTVTAGTGVTLSGDLATSVTVALAPGTYAFSVFAAYDETSETPATEDRYSGPASASGTAT